MAEFGRTWMALVRDVSHVARAPGQDQMMAGLVLHAETGLVLGISIAGTTAEALAGAFETALTRPADDLAPAPPTRVVCMVETAPQVRKAIAANTFGSPELVEAEFMEEAEDIFDSLIGHLAGRAQPDEPPSSGDWSHLVGQSAEFLRAEPWSRWSDVVPLSLQLTVHRTVANYVAIVMGNAGVQRGLALYPGMTMPAGLRSPGLTGPGAALAATPSGTLLLMLDPPEEAPQEFAEKAFRYGWPTDAAYLPTWVGVEDDRPSDLSGVDCRRLQVALAAVVAIDSRGPVLAGVAGGTTGRVALANDSHGDFVISQQPPLV